MYLEKLFCWIQSGTSALMSAVGVNLGDEVITTTATFVATVGAIHFVDVKAVFVECDYW